MYVNSIGLEDQWYYHLFKVVRLNLLHQLLYLINSYGNPARNQLAARLIHHCIILNPNPDVVKLLRYAWRGAHVQAGFDGEHHAGAQYAAGAVFDGFAAQWVFALGDLVSLAQFVARRQAYQVTERKDPLSGEPIKNRPSRILRPGMVLTIEPGLYVRPAPGVPEKFHNIGIRIEDDAVVTEKGCELISRGVPVGVEEIEKLMDN